MLAKGIGTILQMLYIFKHSVYAAWYMMVHDNIWYLIKKLSKMLYFGDTSNRTLNSFCAKLLGGNVKINSFILHQFLLLKSQSLLQTFYLKDKRTWVIHKQYCGYCWPNDAKS